MADGTLSFEEFCKLLTEAERCQRYTELSDHDKFRARISMPPGPGVWVPCNDCAHRIVGKPACKAHPEGLTADHIRSVMEDPTIECGKGFYFKKQSSAFE